MINITETNYSGNVSDYAYEYFVDVFQDTQIFGNDWIFNTLFAAIVLLLITRDMSKWRYMAFPAVLFIHIIGIPSNYTILMLTGILFAISIFGRVVLGEGVKFISRTKKVKGGSLLKRHQETGYTELMPGLSQQQMNMLRFGRKKK